MYGHKWWQLALKQLEPAAVHEQKDAEILRHQTNRDLAQLRRIHVLVPYSQALRCTVPLYTAYTSAIDLKDEALAS